MKKKQEEEAKKKKKEEELASKQTKNPLAAFDKAKQTIDLGVITEGITEVKKENEGTRKLLDGFKHLNVKIHLLTDKIDKLYTK